MMSVALEQHLFAQLGHTYQLDRLSAPHAEIVEPVILVMPDQTRARAARQADIRLLSAHRNVHIFVRRVLIRRSASKYQFLFWPLILIIYV